MGYETKIFIIDEHTSPMLVRTEGGKELQLKTGSIIAEVHLSKCGDGTVGSLISSSVPKEPTHCLWAFEPDRQTEAVDLLREVAGHFEADGFKDKTSDEINQISNDIEDGVIALDKYGDPLGVIDGEKFLNALNEEIAEAESEPYRRFVIAAATLKSVLDTFQNGQEQIKVITYGY